VAFLTNGYIHERFSLCEMANDQIVPFGALQPHQEVTLPPRKIIRLEMRPR